MCVIACCVTQCLDMVGLFWRTKHDDCNQECRSADPWLHHSYVPLRVRGKEMDDMLYLHVTSTALWEMNLEKVASYL